MSGAIILRAEIWVFIFSTENAALARRVLQLFKNNYDVKTEVVITRSRRLKKNNRYQVKVVLPQRLVKLWKNYSCCRQKMKEAKHLY